MRLSRFLVPGSFLVLLGVNALRVEKRDYPAVLSIPLQKVTPGNSSAPVKKRQTVESPDINYLNQLLYIVELQIGTPPQTTYVQLDTGSSDLIVETPSSDICSTAPPNPCTNFGSCKNHASTISSKLSKLYRFSKQLFNVRIHRQQFSSSLWRR